MNEQPSKTAFDEVDSFCPKHLDGAADHNAHRRTENCSRRPSATTIVPPIRTLSTRKPAHYPSAANLGATESTAIHPRTVSSATIVTTIQRLEELLHEACEVAEMVAEKEDDAAAPRTVKPSPGIRSRAASIIGPPFDLNKQIETSLPRGKRRIRFATTDLETHQEDGEEEGISDSLRACGSAHHSSDGAKAAPSPAIVSEDFELKPMIPRKHAHSRFVENLEPTPLPKAYESLKSQQEILPRRRSASSGSLSTKEIKEHVKLHKQPPIGPRSTSARRRFSSQEHSLGLPPALKLNDEETSMSSKELSRSNVPTLEPRPGDESHFTEMFGINSRQQSIDIEHLKRQTTPKIDLRRTRHVDVHDGTEDFDVHESCDHAPVARDWPVSRKRFAAAIACTNAACIGILIGIYAGEVPAIQYVIVDFNHYTILGNVFLYLGLAVSTLFAWPLPLLHGRKPYSITAAVLALCLQIPQGIAVSEFRSPSISTYRALLLLSRGASGFVLGFMNMNVFAMLLDLFGASLQSRDDPLHPSDPYDVRRHGGGMGFWLGFWCCCSTASISIGFLIGALIVNSTEVSWGFWTALLLLMVVLMLNIIAPEPRRAAFRRTVADISGEAGGFSRVTRGEVKMHLKGTGPLWWGEEVKAGLEMCWLMLKQPGFLILTIYAAWTYAQFTVVLMFLGALTSTYYMVPPAEVGLCVASLAIGAIIASPFQKASFLSRARYHPPHTDSMTFVRHGPIYSHLLRRVLFTLLLPLATIGYAATSKGRPMSIAGPCVFAGLVGFCSSLSISECISLILENFDTSDLQPGMTGRPPQKPVVARHRQQRTNFSCYPRISAGMALTQFWQFTFGAAATGLCGRIERRLGAMLATGIMAAVLLSLTVLLALTLVRWKTVEMLPSTFPTAGKPDTKDINWVPVILGAPSGTKRRISVLEHGNQSRWSEIRRRNRVSTGLTGA